MFCPKCGIKNEKGVSFCAACGAEMVDNQPSRQTAELDSLRKKIGQLPTKINALPNIVKGLSLAVFVLIILAISLNVIASALTDPANIVKGYFQAKADGDWNKVFGYLSLDSTEFVNKDSYSKYMKNERTLDIVNFNISEISTNNSPADPLPGNSANDSLGISSPDNPDFFKVYRVEYLLKGSSSTQTETITLVKKAKKKFLFYDNYQVNAVGMTCSDYRVHIPKDAVALIDNIKLTNIANDLSDFDTYTIPEIFYGEHNLRVEHPQCEIYSEQIQVYEGYESYVRSLTVKDTVKSDLARQTEEIFTRMISSALEGDGFETLNLSAGSSIKDSYSTLASAFKSDEDGTGCRNFAVTNFTDNSSGIMDDFGLYSCEMSVGYDYTTVSKDDWTGEPIEFSDSGYLRITFTYTYEDDVWVLSDAYSQTLRLGYGESVPLYEEVVPLIYDYISDFNDGLAVVRVGDLELREYGVIDKNGNTVVEVGKYDYIGSFSDGLATINLGGTFEWGENLVHGGKWGFIDVGGREVVPPKYDYAMSFSDGMAAINIGSEGFGYGGKWGFIDPNGIEIIPPRYDLYRHPSNGINPYVVGFIDGLALVSLDDSENAYPQFGDAVNGNKWGYINKAGLEVVPIKYAYAALFSEGMATVASYVENPEDRPDGPDYWPSHILKCGYVNVVGEEVVPLKYTYAGEFHEGMASVMGDNGWGYIDKTGSEVVPPKYDYVYSFSDGLAAVSIGSYEYSEGERYIGKWGFIDKRGYEVVPLIYDYVNSFYGGVARVNMGASVFESEWGLYENGGEWSYIDKTGKVVEPLEDTVDENYSNGLMAVNNGGKWGFEDIDGKEIVPCEFDAVGSYSDGMATVMKDGKWGVISIKL